MFQAIWWVSLQLDQNQKHHKPYIPKGVIFFQLLLSDSSSFKTFLSLSSEKLLLATEDEVAISCSNNKSAIIQLNCI